MEPDSSIQQSQSSLIENIELPIFNIPMKRGSLSVEEGASVKASKRRRSSLAARRKSIVSDEVNANTDSEFSSQESTASSEHPTEDPTQATKPKPNPVNVKMDATIMQIRAKVSELDAEYSQWLELLQDMEMEEEQTAKKAKCFSLPAEEIPAEVKDLGMSTYVTCSPLDLDMVRDKVRDLLSQYHFDREACAQDLKLINETAESLSHSNTLLASRLATSLRTERTRDDSDGQHHLQPASIDPKDVVQGLINSSY